MLTVAFDDLELDEVVSFTAVTNERSQAVMRRIGMTHDPADDFDHPLLDAGSPLRRHVLYRLRRPLQRVLRGSGDLRPNAQIPGSTKKQRRGQSRIASSSAIASASRAKSTSAFSGCASA